MSAISQELWFCMCAIKRHGMRDLLVFSYVPLSFFIEWMFTNWKLQKNKNKRITPCCWIHPIRFLLQIPVTILPRLKPGFTRSEITSASKDPVHPVTWMGAPPWTPNVPQNVAPSTARGVCDAAVHQVSHLLTAVKTGVFQPLNFFIVLSDVC